MTRVRRVGWQDPDFAALRHAQQDELAAVYGFDDVGREMTGDGVIAAVVVDGDDGTPAACGALRDAPELGVGTGEIKRMYVRPELRGRGLSRRALDALEWEAARAGMSRVVLETGVLQPAAIGLYLTSGYTPISNYPPYDEEPSSRCFAKRLVTLGTDPAPPVLVEPPDEEPAATSGSMPHQPLYDLTLTRVDYFHPGVVRLRRQMADELAGLYGMTAWFADAATMTASDAADAPFVVSSLLAREGDAPVGTMTLRVARDGWPEEWAEVVRAFVVPEARGRGIARAMLAAVEDEARALGTTRLVLDTGFLQVPSITLYLSCGFRPIEPFGEWFFRPRLLWFGKDL